MKKGYSYRELTDLINSLVSKTEKFSSLSDELITTKPDPSSWCVGEIFEHLVMFNEIYLDMIRSAVKPDDLPTFLDEHFSPRMLISPVIRFIKPPYKIKINTIAPMSPLDIDSDNYRQQYGQLLITNRELLTLIDELEFRRLDLNKIKFRHRIFFIKMSLIEYILLLEAHQSRHLWQAEQTLFKISN
tara:strand:- start:14070 stop:14630 length:561 start_codon:yes stop_codon:yes gene_type:complete